MRNGYVVILNTSLKRKCSKKLLQLNSESEVTLKLAGQGHVVQLFSKMMFCRCIFSFALEYHKILHFI